MNQHRSSPVSSLSIELPPGDVSSSSSSDATTAASLSQDPMPQDDGVAVSVNDDDDAAGTTEAVQSSLSLASPPSTTTQRQYLCQRPSFPPSRRPSGSSVHSIGSSSTHHHHNYNYNTTPTNTHYWNKTTSGQDTNNNHHHVDPSAEDHHPDRLYRPRDAAAVDFLLGIPLAVEAHLVQTGWNLQQQKMVRLHSPPTMTRGSSGGYHYHDAVRPAPGTWWGKYIVVHETSTTHQNYYNYDQLDHTTTTVTDEDCLLERSEHRSEHHHHHLSNNNNNNTNNNKAAPDYYTPDPRLDGDAAAVRIQIPVRPNVMIETTRTGVAEREEAHPQLLDARVFFSADSAYPVGVFSAMRPRAEVQLRTRQEELVAGGGSHFVTPTRDWRGISYRALLRPSSEPADTTFNRFISDQKGPHSDDTLYDSDDSDDSVDLYVLGFVDDPNNMTLGRRRNIMIGDQISGPMAMSTTQFVEHVLLKAELNQQFRERGSSEPPPQSRQYVGAYVSVAEVLQDPTEGGLDDDERPLEEGTLATTTKTKKKPLLRIPPSLLLSKTRSIKQQALAAAVKANVEIGTVALACVYFERLCLDSRVDKSNRRLTFAACMFLASKVNEPNIDLVMTSSSSSGSLTSLDDSKKNSRDASANEGQPSLFRTAVQTNQHSRNIFALLLEFFTQEWNVSTKTLLNAEWGVFAALHFDLHAAPSRVAHHFRRLLQELGHANARQYLGDVMWQQWRDVLAEEDRRDRERAHKKGLQRQRRIRDLELELEHQVRRRRRASSIGSSEAPSSTKPPLVKRDPSDESRRPMQREASARKFFLGKMRRIVSGDRLAEKMVVPPPPTKTTTMSHKPPVPSPARTTQPADVDSMV